MNIPKIINQVWVNNQGSPPPARYQLHTNTLRDMNPDFEYKIWLDDQVNALFQKEPYREFWEVYNQVPYSIMKADIARWVVLHHQGGVYSDMDFVGLRPLSGLLEQYPNNSIIVAIEPMHKISMSKKCINGFFLVEKEHPVCLEVISSIIEACVGVGRGHVDIINTTGPGKVYSVLSRHQEFLSEWVIPRKYILPVLEVYDPHDDDGSAYVSTMWQDGTNWVSEIAVDMIRLPVVNYNVIVPIAVVVVVLFCIYRGCH